MSPTAFSPACPDDGSFESRAGFSSAFHNPFIGIVDSATTEVAGEAYGFSLIYTGSFSASVERDSLSLDRVQIGMNPLHLSWPLSPGATFDTPEAVAVYSATGLGDMSRFFHRLYRNHLSRSSWTLKDRPVVINHWEATEFDYDGDTIYEIAKAGSELGCTMVSHPRPSDGGSSADSSRPFSTMPGSVPNTRATRIGPDLETGRSTKRNSKVRSMRWSSESPA